MTTDSHTPDPPRSPHKARGAARAARSGLLRGVSGVAMSSPTAAAAGCYTLSRRPPLPLTGIGERRVVLELSRLQVRQVVAAVSGQDSIVVLLSVLEGLRDVPDTRPERIVDLLADRRYSRSLLCGLLVLTAFPSDGEYVGLHELAGKLPMSTSNVHRYLSTLLAVELVERDPVTRRYRLAVLGTLRVAKDTALRARHPREDAR